MTEKQDMVVMEFMVPTINRSLHLLEADPFKFMLNSHNKSCQIEYGGPKNMIVNTEKDCAIGVNLMPGHDTGSRP